MERRYSRYKGRLPANIHDRTPLAGAGFDPDANSVKKIKFVEGFWTGCGCVLPLVGGGAAITALYWISQHVEEVVRVIERMGR